MEMEAVFNSCCVLGRAKCGVYKPKWVDYKPYWGMWEDGATFVASMSAGRILHYIMMDPRTTTKACGNIG